MKLQIAREIFLNDLSIMKEVLSLAEFKLGKETQDYIYFKKKIMDNFYNGLIRLFQKLEYEKIVQKCECMSKLRHGYAQCDSCGGSGYKNYDPKPAEVAQANG
jgi:hypothetical protein